MRTPAFPLPAVLLIMTLHPASVLSDPTPALSQAELQAKWAAIGDVAPLYPVQEATANGGKALSTDPAVNGSLKLGIAPNIDGERVQSWNGLGLSTTTAITGYELVPQPVIELTKKALLVDRYPVFRDFVNTYMPLSAHALYGAEFSATPGKREFSGASFSAIYSVPTLSAPNPSVTKDVIGYQTTTRKSSASADDTAASIFNAVHSTTNFSILDSEPGDPALFRRWFVDLLCGSLSEAKLAAWRTEANPDARSFEGDNVNENLAVKFLIGTTALLLPERPVIPSDAIFRFSTFYDPESKSQITPAVAMEKTRSGNAGVVWLSMLLRWTFDSYVNVAAARGFAARLDLGNESGGRVSSDSSRRIRRWSGIEIAAHSSSPTSTTVVDYGMQLQEQSALLTESDRPKSFGVSISSKGVHVLGDSASDPDDTGYRTDVVHVRDVLRLPMEPVLPKLEVTPPGTIVFSQKDEASAVRPGLYVCLISGASKGWRRIAPDYVTKPVRIARADGLVAGPSNPNVSQAIKDAIEEHGGDYLRTRIVAQWEEGAGGGVLRLFVRPVRTDINSGQLVGERLGAGGEIFALPNKSGKSGATGTEWETWQEFRYSADELVPTDRPLRSASDVRQGVPPNVVRFSINEGTPQFASVEFHLD